MLSSCCHRHRLVTVSVFIVLVLVVMVLPDPAQGKWQLAWADEFDGQKLNQSNWAFQYGSFGGWTVNKEQQCYSDGRNDHNARVVNGSLVIEARVEKCKLQPKQNFTSARLYTLQAWRYGRFEVRARLPAGRQLWPAIWLVPARPKFGQWASSGEIDIMEYKGEHRDQIIGTIHYGGPRPYNERRGSGWKKSKADFSAEWHVFGLEWTAKDIRWLLDGQEYHRESISRWMWSGKGKPNPYTAKGQPFDQPFRLILNVAVSGRFFGPPPYITPSQAHTAWTKRTMEVDWVRVFKWT